MFRKWLSVIVLVTLLTSLFVSFPVQSADTLIDKTLPPTLDIVFNPTGTHIDKDGYLKIRLDFYPREGDKSYASQHVYVPIIPESGFPGKVDKDGNPIDQKEYDTWLNGLSHEWKLNPVLCHFVTVPAYVKADDVLAFIQKNFYADVTATIDDIMVQENSMHLISPYMRNKTVLASAPLWNKDNLVSTTSIVQEMLGKGLLTENEITDATQDTVKAKELVSKVNTYVTSEINQKLSGLEIKAGVSVGKTETVKPESIDVGAEATNRSTQTNPSYTIIDKTNPANADGTLDTFELWFNVTDGANVVVGTLSGATWTYTSRDSETIGAVTCNSKQTFTGKNCDVSTGDIIGCYYSAGYLERDASGGTGAGYLSGNQFGAGEQTYSFLGNVPHSLYATGTEASSAPTVVTNPTINIEETTATASGNITVTSANTTEQYFQFGTATGTYTDNVTTTENLGVGEMQFSLTGLTPGELYFGRAGAKIDGDIGWGDEVTWIQKPEPATDFHSSDNGTSWIFLEWTNGIGMDLVGIRYDTGSAPSDNETGTQGYWGSDSSANITGLSDNTTYFFRIDTYATEGGLWSKADTDVTCSDKTDELTVPSVNTNAATLVEETTATLNGEITNIGTGGVNAARFDWGTSTGIYTDNNTQSANDTSTTFTYDMTTLTKGEAYYFRASANNTAGWGYGTEQKFLTKPDLPTGINLTPGAGEIFIEWNPADGADKYMVRGSTSGYPANYADGVEVYFGTEVSTTHTGLGNNETWYYCIWSYCTEDGMEQWSDSYTFGTVATDIIAPVITGNAATGVTDNDATLNGTLNDGGEACTVVWYWGLTDEGETEAWSNNSTQVAQVTGPVSYTISGTLAASTTYFWTIHATNSAGEDWSVSGNFTTTATPITMIGTTPFNSPIETTDFPTDIIAVEILAMFSLLAFWKKNPAMFMILFTISVPIGLSMPDIISSSYSTDGIDMVLALMFILYGFFCAGWSLKLLSAPSKEVE